MRVFITGCCGFIGRRLAQQCQHAGHTVFGTDLSDTAPPEIASNRYFQAGAGGFFRSALDASEPDWCLHTAGRASVAGSFEDPKSDFEAGPQLTFELLNAIREAAPSCRVVFMSSAAVYGQPEQLPIKEEQATNPISPYGFHKRQSEMLMREFHDIYQVSTASVRIFSAYGIGLQRQVLWDISNRLIRDGQLTLRGTGTESRDFINVEDVVSGVLTVAEKAPARGEVYNLSTGVETTIGDLASLAIAGLNLSVEPVFDGTTSVGDPLNWRADISSITSLGFKPQVELEDGIARYARWCRDVIG